MQLEFNKTPQVNPVFKPQNPDTAPSITRPAPDTSMSTLANLRSSLCNRVHTLVVPLGTITTPVQNLAQEEPDTTVSQSQNISINSCASRYDSWTLPSLGTGRRHPTQPDVNLVEVEDNADWTPPTPQPMEVSSPTPAPWPPPCPGRLLTDTREDILDSYDANDKLVIRTRSEDNTTEAFSTSKDYYPNIRTHPKLNP